MSHSSINTGHAAVSIGLMLHLAPNTKIYCDLHRGQPPALVIGTEPADCVISSANFEADATDLIAADRLLAAVTAYRDEMRRQVAENAMLDSGASTSETTKATSSERGT